MYAHAVSRHKLASVSYSSVWNSCQILQWCVTCFASPARLIPGRHGGRAALKLQLSHIDLYSCFMHSHTNVCPPTHWFFSCLPRAQPIPGPLRTKNALLHVPTTPGLGPGVLSTTWFKSHIHHDLHTFTIYGSVTTQPWYWEEFSVNFVMVDFT